MVRAVRSRFAMSHEQTRGTRASAGHLLPLLALLPVPLPGIGGSKPRLDGSNCTRTGKVLGKHCGLSIDEQFHTDIGDLIINNESFILFVYIFTYSLHNNIVSNSEYMNWFIDL